MSARVKISFHTLGCRLNQAESASLQNRFLKAGYEVVDFGRPADVVVINTCTVTEHGDTDTRRLVNRLHRSMKSAKIALIGCQSQVQGEHLLQLPGVQWVIGNAAKMDLPSILLQHGACEPFLMIPAISKESFTVPGAAIDRKHTRANLKIQDGCNFFCSFCEIPYARGRTRSRQLPDLLREANELAGAGYREIVLTGVNVGTYDDGGKSLPDVLAALSTFDGIRRIRISSIEMTTIPNEIFRPMQTGKVCRFLHVPLQSGSDKILRAMNRKYCARDFARFIHQAYAAVPDICLGADVMVGFPGETEHDFQLTTTLLQSLPLAYFHVFSYSDRPHARSRHLANKVSETDKQSRSRLLRQLSQKKRRQYFQRFTGSVQEALFEEEKHGLWTGLTDHYIRVRVTSSQNLHNQLRRVRLQDIDGMAMLGTLV
ncbi:tRNA (N(6)-L-threonylcarbamoyladenosine(37)-C(2))-methylthiotransferase MtaB [candidate division KSB1 bacterium]|nr:tRNA (N(6)-L-threonylcarbamoyladenosine(37)-C(2))-methylthiotransferase MtaB [candidate division KSB1 bacterium]